MISLVTSIIIAYLIGSITTAVWYGKKFHNIDVREFGSGNAGATNTFRVLGKKAGGIVFGIDVMKGFIAANVANILFESTPFSENIILFKIILGVSCVIGHVFPIFASFKGGKGVATLLGITIALHPLAAVFCLFCFIIILLTTKYVSLGSMLSALIFCIILQTKTFETNNNLTLTIYGLAVFILLVLTHTKNIKRLLAGNENKIYLFKKN